MARTNTPLVVVPANGAVSPGAGTTADPTNGHIIPAANDVEHLLIRVANTSGAGRTATIKAGVGESSGQGDMTAVTIAATTGVQVFGPLESARYAQADGSVWLDLEAGFTGSVTPYRVPRSA